MLQIFKVLDRSGKEIYGDSIPLKSLEKIGFSWRHNDISTDGKYLACEVRAFGSADIWIINLETKEPERVTFSTSIDETPVWSPDGKAIAFSSSASGTIRQLLVKDLSQSGNPRLIRTWPRHIHFSDWSSDGKWFAVDDINPKTLGNCYAISIDSGDSIPIAISENNEHDAKFSPDGKWIAYTSDESGRSEIYIVSFPTIGNKKQLTNEGASTPRWDGSGNSIYYMTGNQLMSVEVNTDKEFKKGKVIKLFSTSSSIYLPSPDGKKFYVIAANPNRSNPPLNLVINWFKDLEKRNNK